MSRLVKPVTGILVMVSVFLCVFRAVGDGAKASGQTGGTMALYDTVEPANLGDTVAAIVAAGTWKRLGKDAGSVQGDAVLVNDKLAAVARKDGSGVDLYAKSAEGWSRRARLAPVVGGKVAKLEGIKAVSGEEGSIAVEAKVRGAKDGAIMFSLKDGHLPAVKATARGAVEALRIIAPCRIAVLPDFFADDLMVDAREIPVAKTEIPSDNFFLHMVSNGDSIVAAVWEKNERDVAISLAGEGEKRVIASTDVFFGSGAKGSIWTAALEHKNIWHSANITKEQHLKGGPLEGWTVPFAAKWKGDFTREDKVIQSVPFCPRGHGGRSAYEIKKTRGGFVVHLKRPSDTKFKDFVPYQGLMVAYPISRLDPTPLDQMCLDDLMRNCLGMEACGYILDVGSRTKTDKGIFTCSYGAMFNKLAPREMPRHSRVMAATLKEERAYIKHVNEQVLIFVKHIQDRINAYVDFLEGILAYLDEQEKKHPDQSEFTGRIRDKIKEDVRIFSRFSGSLKRADGVKRSIPILKTVYDALEVDTPQQATRIRPSGIPQGIGDPQDARVAQLRRRVKVLRAMATKEMAVNPGAGEIAKEIRRRSEAMLRNPTGYERPITW